MTENLKGLNIPSSIVPFTDQDVYATHDSKFGKGGWQSVETVTEMNNISMQRRSIGMAVYVASEKQTYILNGRLDNLGWVTYSDRIDKHFTYSDHRYTPSDHWVIHHGLNKKPSVQIFDADGIETEGGITIVDDNNITIDFNIPFCGTAELN